MGNRASEKSAAGQPPVAIVGMSCLFPGAQSLEEYWANIRNGTDAIGEVPETHWSPEEYYDPDPKRPDHVYCKRGGFLSPVDYDPARYGIAPNNLDATDASQLLSLVVAEGALRDAGYGPGRDFDRERTSCILGVTGTLQLAVAMGGRLGHPVWRRNMIEAGIAPEIADEVVKNIGDSFAVWQENSFPGLLGNVVAGRIANRFDLGGTNCVVDAACASSISAVHLAALELSSGRADMVITGGVDTFNDIFMYMCFSKTPALSPTGDARPFDAGADGTILGEGIGMVVLKRLDDAERDGDRVYAVLRGVGSSSDGKGKAIYAPSADGQEKALKRAYANAGVTPASIGLVEAHGTGTRVGDGVEVSALRRVYSARTDDAADDAPASGPWCALGSVKSQIGHTKAAAGVAGMIKAALALRHKVLPPTIKVDTPNPEVTDDSPFYVNTEKRPWLSRPDHPRRAAVSSFGFGGSNFHMVMEEHEPAKREIDWDGRVQIIALSDSTLDGLRSKAESWRGIRGWNEIRARATESRRTFVVGDRCRLIMVVEQGRTDLERMIRNVGIHFDRDETAAHWSLPEGVYFSQGRRAEGKLAFLFPGQGAQYVNMARDLVCMFPKMQEILTDANLAYDDMADLACQLSDFIFPHATFSEEARKLNELALRATHVAQPAIGAIGLGMICVLSMFAVHPEMAAGHSFGELIALCAGGKLDARTLHELAILRGRLMAEGEGDRGAMLAVQDSLERVEELLRREGLEVVIANRNAPRQAVLSGATAEIERAAAAFRAAGVNCTLLPVAAAFHSELVAAASEPFREVLREIGIREGHLPVYSNTTGAVYPSDAESARDLLGGQLARPVEFVREIETMYADGARIFLEVGPGSRMAGLVRQTLEGRDVHTLSLDASGGRGNGAADLARVLGQLAALGRDVRLADWDPGAAETVREAEGGRRPAMSFKLTGANYRKPQTVKTAQGAPPAAVAATRPHEPGNGAKKTPVMDQPVSMTSTEPSVSLPPPQAAARAAVAAPAPPVEPPPPRPVHATNGHANGHIIGNGHHHPFSDAGSSAASFPRHSDSSLSRLFQITQGNLEALQRIQEQTADLHRQFLEGQELALRTFHGLVERQFAGLTGQPSVPVPSFAAPAMTTPAPAPASVPPAAPAAAYAPPAPAPAPVPAPVTAVTHPQPAAISAAHVSPATPARPAGSPAPAAAPLTGLHEELLRVVSDKTGYPVGMITGGMDLEADLGIDSIKRVEILSALQEAMPSLPAVEPEDLGRLRTLDEIVAHMESLGGGVSSAAAPAAASSPVGQSGTKNGSSPSPSLVGLPDALLNAVADKTGYPAEMLNFEMDLEADLGIDSIKRVEILSALQEAMPDLPAVEPEDLGRLRTLGEILAHMNSLAGPAGGGEPATAPATISVAPVAPVAVPADTAPADTAPASSVIRGSLLDIVADKTGYPVDMLDAGMDLESDLGIDSIKRVEILSAMQDAHPELPPVDPEELGRLRTLEQILSALSASGSAASANGSGNVALAQPSGISPVPESPTERTVLVRRVPVARRAEDCGAGVSAIPQGARFAVTDDGTLLSATVCNLLRQRGFNADVIAPSAFDAISSMRDLAGLVVIGGVSEPGESGLWSAESEERLSAAFRIVRAAAPILASSGGNGSAPRAATLVTISRMDGRFGLGGLPARVDALSGGLAGLAKTAAAEWPGVQCKALDVDAAWADESAAAHAIIDEIFRIAPDGVTETGLGEGERWSVAEIGADDLPLDGAGVGLSPGDVVIITGGARGVTAEVARSLAERWRPTLVLLGRSGRPEEEPAAVRGLTSEREIKQALASGRSVSPREIEKEFRKLMAGREIRENLARIKAAGSRVVYHPTDVRDATAVAGLFDEIRTRVGPIRGIIHGAGVLADKAISEKTDEQFARVFATKVSGLRSLLGAAAGDDLKLLVLFSSVSGRYGRRGQVDYSMANEVLNKVAQAQRSARPGCRVVSVNWGPWDGGMVQGGLRDVFHSEGIGLIPLREGARYLVDEIGSGAGAVEVVVTAGTASDKSPPARVEHGVDGEAAAALASGHANGSANGSANGNGRAGIAVAASPDARVAFRRELDPATHPFLASHVIDGSAVLPAAVIIEWLAHGAMHGNPGLEFAGLEDLRILRGVVLGEGSAASVEIAAARGIRSGAGIEVETLLRASDEGREERRNGAVRSPNASARVILSSASSVCGRVPGPVPEGPAWGGAVSEFYETRLFHGADFQGIEEVEVATPDAMVLRVRCAPDPSEWMEHPPRSSWITDPLVLDCAFQGAVAWCARFRGAPSLPSAVGAYRQFVRAYPSGGARIAIRFEPGRGNIVRAEMDILDLKGSPLARIEGYECVLNPNLSDAFTRNRLPAGVTRV